MVIDYTTQDDLGGGKLYDLVFDAVGRRKTSALKVVCSQALAPGGKYLSVDDEMPKMSASGLALLNWAFLRHALLGAALAMAGRSLHRRERALGPRRRRAARR